MAISDQVTEQMESKATSGSSFVKSSALWLLLITAQYEHSGVVPSVTYQPFGQTSQSSAYASSATVSDEVLLAQLMKMYSELAESQIDISAEDKKLLYDNLWDLYA